MERAIARMSSSCMCTSWICVCTLYRYRSYEHKVKERERASFLCSQTCRPSHTNQGMWACSVHSKLDTHSSYNEIECLLSSMIIADEIRPIFHLLQNRRVSTARDRDRGRERKRERKRCKCDTQLFWSSIYPSWMWRVRFDNSHSVYILLACFARCCVRVFYCTLKYPAEREQNNRCICHIKCERSFYLTRSFLCGTLGKFMACEWTKYSMVCVQEWRNYPPRIKRYSDFELYCLLFSLYGTKVKSFNAYFRYFNRNRKLGIPCTAFHIAINWTWYWWISKTKNEKKTATTTNWLHHSSSHHHIF